MNQTRRLVLALAAVAMLLSACGEDNFGSLRIAVNDDFSGKLLVVRLSDREQLAVSRGDVTAVDWEGAAEVSTAAGSFSNLDELQFGEITFETGRNPKGLRYVRVHLPRGPDVRWPAMLTTTTLEQRAQMQLGAGDTPLSKGSVELLGTTVKLEINLPRPPVGHGVTNPGRGIKESAKRSTVSLVMNVERLLAADEPLTWHVTWE